MAGGPFYPLEGPLDGEFRTRSTSGLRTNTLLLPSVYQMSTRKSAGGVGAQGIAGWEELSIKRRVYQMSTKGTF